MKLPAVMRQYRVWLLFGVLLWLACIIFHPFEPRYQGRRLSVWVEDLSFNIEDANSYSQKHQQAVEAIRHFGISGLPYALKLCRAEDSALKSKLIDWSDDWNRNHELLKITFSREEDAHKKSAEMFAALGSMGKPAIPSLMKLLGSNDPDIANTASCALTSIGTNAIPLLIVALTDQNARVRKYAAITLGSFEAQARSAGPALLQCLKDENRGVREYAALCLGSIQEDPRIVVPAIMAALEKETNSPPLAMIMALSHFGTNAKSAVPLLIKILESQKPMSPLGVLSALRRIDPESAKPYVEKWKASITNAQARWLADKSTNAPVGTPVEKPPQETPSQ